MNLVELLELKNEYPELIAAPFINNWDYGGAFWKKEKHWWTRGHKQESFSYHIGYKVDIIRSKDNVKFTCILGYTGNSFTLIKIRPDENLIKIKDIDGMSIQKFVKKVKLMNPSVSFVKRKYDEPYLKRIEKSINKYINGETTKLKFDWDVK